MRYLLLVAYVGLCGCGQDDNIVTPPPPGNLDKTPTYDLSLMLYPRDLGVTVEPDDLSMSGDGGGSDAGGGVDAATDDLAGPDLRVTDHPDQG